MVVFGQDTDAGHLEHFGFEARHRDRRVRRRSPPLSRPSSMGRPPAHLIERAWLVYRFLLLFVRKQWVNRLASWVKSVAGNG